MTHLFIKLKHSYLSPKPTIIYSKQQNYSLFSKVRTFSLCFAIAAPGVSHLRGLLHSFHQNPIQLKTGKQPNIMTWQEFPKKTSEIPRKKQNSIGSYQDSLIAQYRMENNRLGRSSLEKEMEVPPGSQQCHIRKTIITPDRTSRSTARNYVTQSSPLSWNTAPFWGISVEEAATWYKAQGRSKSLVRGADRAHKEGQRTVSVS